MTAVVYSGLLVAVRRTRELMWFVGGLATVTFGFFPSEPSTDGRASA